MKNCDVVKKLMEEYDVSNVEELCVILGFLLERMRIRLNAIDNNLQYEHLFSRIQYLENLLSAHKIDY